jgi:hypothetical protein
MHIPIFDPKSIPMDCAVIYKASGGRRAILFLGKQTSPEDYLAVSELGETVSKSLFPA